MTIKELITQLQKYPEDAKVEIETNEGYSELYVSQFFGMTTIKNEDYLLIDITIQSPDHD